MRRTLHEQDGVHVLLMLEGRERWGALVEVFADPIDGDAWGWRRVLARLMSAVATMGDISTAPRRPDGLLILPLLPSRALIAMVVEAAPPSDDLAVRYALWRSTVAVGESLGGEAIEGIL